MLKLVIFFSLIIPIFCGKLSEEFDEERAEVCGIVNKRTAFDSSKSPQLLVSTEKPSTNHPDDIAPWSVAIRSTEDTYYLNAVIISPRHILASPIMVIQTNDTANKIWEWIDNRPVDIKQCQDFEMKIPKKLLKTFKIRISICQDKDRCGTNIERSVVDGYYIGNCELGEIPFGMLLLEISSNIPQNEPFFTPVCVPAEKEPVQPNDVVHFDSLKVTNHVTYVTSNKATIEKCPANIGTFVQSMCAKRDQCITKSGGRGGSLVKKIDERDTIVGISSFYENCPDGHFVSVGFFKDKLCSLAGICKTTIAVSESSFGASLHLIYLITTALLFL